MVGRCIPYWNSPFLGDMLVFWGVYAVAPTNGANSGNKIINQKKEVSMPFKPFMEIPTVEVLRQEINILLRCPAGT